MIYVPILKNRQQEMKIVKDLNMCFSEKLIPLIEIVNEEYKKRYLVNELTGEIEYEIKSGNKRKTKVELEATDEDIITLQNLSKRLGDKKAFIDYFRFKEEEYPKVKLDLKGVELSLILSRNFDLYKSKLLGLSSYNNLIPVISVKKQFPISVGELERLIIEVQEKTPIIALRVTADMLDDYEGIIKRCLRKEDYFLFDIREQSVEARFMELMDVMEFNLEGKMILLNSPRKLSVKNKQYEEFDFTDLIDNSALEAYKEYNFDGVGDYAGLRDILPEYQAGSKNMGHALALLFIKERNKFFSLMNNNSRLGMSGYISIINKILAEKSKVDPDGDCPAICKIERIESSGNWSTWNYITLARTIHQIYKSM